MNFPTGATLAVAKAIARAADADGWTDEIAEWEAMEDWERDAYPDEYPGMAYEDQVDYINQAEAAIAAAWPFLQGGM